MWKTRRQRWTETRRPGARRGGAGGEFGTERDWGVCEVERGEAGIARGGYEFRNQKDSVRGVIFT